MAQNPFLSRGILGVDQATLDYYNQNGLPGQALNDYKRQKIADIQTQTDALLAQQAEAQHRAEEQQQAQLRAQTEQTVQDATSRYLLGAIPGVDTLMSGGQAPAESNAYQMTRSDGQIFNLDLAVLRESDNPQTLFNEWLKTQPEFMQLSTAGRKKLAKDQFAAFVNDVYTNVRGTPEKVVSPVNMQQTIDQLIEANPNLFDAGDWSVIGQAKDLVVAVGAGAAKFGGAVVNHADSLGNMVAAVFNEKVLGDTAAAEEDWQDHADAVNRNLRYQQSINELQQAWSSDLTTDTMKQLAEADTVGDMGKALAENPLYIVTYLAEMAGTGGVGGAALKGGAKITTALATKATPNVVQKAVQKELLTKLGDGATRVYQKALPTGSAPLVAMALNQGGSSMDAVYQQALDNGTAVRDVAGEAVLTGAATAGLTAASGRFLPTIEGTMSRAFSRDFQHLTGVAKQAMEKGQQEARTKVGKWIQAKTNTPAAGLMGRVFKGAGTEFGEEFAVSAIERAAVEALQADGTWGGMTDEKWDRVFNDAFKAGVLGAIIGAPVGLVAGHYNKSRPTPAMEEADRAAKAAEQTRVAAEARASADEQARAQAEAEAAAQAVEQARQQQSAAAQAVFRDNLQAAQGGPLRLENKPLDPLQQAQVRAQDRAVQIQDQAARARAQAQAELEDIERNAFFERAAYARRDELRRQAEDGQFREPVPVGDPFVPDEQRAVTDWLHNIDVTPETEQALDDMLNSVQFGNEPLVVQAQKAGLKNKQIADALVKKVLASNDIESYAPEVADYFKALDNQQAARLATVNWLLGQFDIAPQARVELARYLFRAPAFADMVATVTNAVYPATDPRNIKTRQQAVDALLRTPRGAEVTDPVLGEMYARLAGTDIAGQVYAAIQTLPEGHPLRVAVDQAPRQTPENLTDSISYKLLRGDEQTAPVSDSAYREFNRRTGTSTSAKQLYYEVYQQALDRMYRGKESPGRIRSADFDALVQTRRADIQTELGFKDNAVQTRTSEIVKAAIQAAIEAYGKKPKVDSGETVNIFPKTRARGGKAKAADAVREAKRRVDNSKESRRAPWEKLTNREKRLYTQDTMSAFIQRIAAQNWDSNIANRVRVVSPDVLPHGEQVNGFVLPNDEHIYIVAHPDMDAAMVNWTIAHEAAHQGMTLRREDGSSVFTGEQYLAMLRDAEGNTTVRKLMDAMRDAYPNADNTLLAEEALAELTAAKMTGHWDNIETRWGLKVAKSFRGQHSGLSKVIEKFVNLIKRLISAFAGRQRVSDSEILDYITRIARNAQSADIKGDMVKARPDQMIKTDMAYREFAKGNVPDFDTQPEADQDAYLHMLANERNNQLAADFYGAKYSKRSAEEKIAFSQAFLDKMQESQAKKDDMFDADSHVRGAAKTAADRVVNAAQQAGQDKDTPQATVDSIINDFIAVRFYQQTQRGQARNENFAGIIIPFKESEQVVVKYQQYNEHGKFVADRKRVYTKRPNETFAELVVRVEKDIVDQNYELREGVRRIKSKLRHGDKEVEIDNFQQMIAGRITRWEMFSPTFTKIAQAIRRVLGPRSEPVLDAMLDLLLTAKAAFLSPEDLIESMENAYNAYGDKNGLTRLNEFMTLRQAKTDFVRQLGRRGTQGHPTFLDFKFAFMQTLAEYRDVVTREQVERHLHAYEARIRDRELLEEHSGQKGSKDNPLRPEDVNLERLYMPGQPQDTLSGFFTKDNRKGDWMAEEYFSKEFKELTPEQQQALEALKDAYIEMVNHTRDLSFQAGLIDAETYYAGKQRGFWVTLKDYKDSHAKNPRPAGRYTKPENIIENSIDQMQRMLQGVYNQHVYQRLARIAMLTPDNDYVEVVPFYPTRVGTGAYDFDYLLDKEGNDADRETRLVKLDNDQFVYLKFKAAGKQLLKPTYSTNGAVKTMTTLTSALSMFQTSLSPAFLVQSVPRDAATVYLNIQGAIGSDLLTTKDAPKVAMQAIRWALHYYPKLAKSAWNENVTDDPLVAVYNTEGAGLSFGARAGFDILRRDLDTNWNRVEQSTIGQRVNALNQKTKRAASRATQAVSYAPEQMFRIGVMRAYMEHLVSTGKMPAIDWNSAESVYQALHADPEIRTKVIQATKDITTNFERYGNQPWVRGFYMFFNAAMQSVFRTLPQIMATEHGRKSVMYLGTALFLQALMAIEMLGDDDDGESKYFRMQGRDRKRWIGNDYAIPLTPDMGWVATFADTAAGLVLGKRSVLDGAGDIMGAATRTAIPLNWWQTEDSMLNFVGGVTPTVLTGVVSDVTNTGFFGNKLVKDVAYDPVTGQRVAHPTALEASPSNSSRIGIGIAEQLSNLGIDKSGAEVDMWMEKLFGGLFRTIRRAQQEADGGADTLEAAFNAVFATGYTSKPNTYAVKDTAERIEARASQLTRKLVADGQKTNLTDRDRKNYEAYRQIGEQAKWARQQAKRIRGPNGAANDVWQRYLDAKEQGDRLAASRFLDEYNKLRELQDSIYATITLKAKDLGVFDDLKE